MLSRLRFGNGREFLNAFHHPGENSVRFWHSKEYVRLSKVQLSSDSLTSTGLIDDSLKDKIIYNDVIHKRTTLLNQVIRKENIDRLGKCKDSGRLPMTSALFMKCMEDSNSKPAEDNVEAKTDIIHFPFHRMQNVLTDDTNNNQEPETNDNSQTRNSSYDAQFFQSHRKNIKFENPKRWMSEVEDDTIQIEDNRFGTCNPNLPASNVPCGGCGALLHCTNMTVPGFIPRENFEGCSESQLRGKLCQRCVFLKEYNVALGVNVNADDYPKIIAQVKNKRVLILLLVDLLDFPCSIWPNILDVLGKDKSLFVIGNKMDLLIEDGEEFVKHRKKCMMYALEDCGITEGNIKHIELISAKTGFGIEKLISAIHAKWGDRGDVYIVGCTNAGKSTLFNTLIQSDFCKSKASDIIQRATVSQWPGTTLNLLKFPMLRPSSWRTALRMQRLKVEKKQEKAFQEVKQAALRMQKGKNYQASLMGFIGRTFPTDGNPVNQIGLDPEDFNFKFGKWCYDTPGVVHEAQILNLLTTSELSKVLPVKAVVPRNFKLEAGNSLFIGGIGRLDFLEGNERVWFTVYASADLPITVTHVEDADFIYQKLLGTDEFAVPHGNEERMEKWPALMSKNFSIYGMYKNVGGGDIVLSSAGWVSVTPSPSSSCKVRAWTPAGRGIFLRKSNLIRNGRFCRGDRIPGTPAYETSLEIIEDIKLRY